MVLIRSNGQTGALTFVTFGKLEEHYTTQCKAYDHSGYVKFEMLRTYFCMLC